MDKPNQPAPGTTGHSAGGAAGKRSSALDGLRGLAILGVMLHHFGVRPQPWFDWGPIAPTLFFFLSGYLITGSLLKARDGEGLSWSWMTGFHLARFARLIPALYVMFLVGWFSGLPEYREGVLWHLGFLSNIFMVMNGEWAGSLSQLWSLSLQEQFYLLWPFLFFLPTRYIVPGMLLVVIGALGYRWMCLAAEIPGMTRWLLLPGSMDAFAAGGLLHILLKRNPDLKPGAWTPVLLIFAGAFWMMARGVRHMDWSGVPWLAFVENFEILCLGLLVFLVLRAPQGRVAKLASLPPLVFLGRISYGLFIWHMLVICSVGPLLESAGLGGSQFLVPRILVLLACSVLVAWLSWIALECPVIAWSKAVRQELPKALARPRRWLSLALRRLQNGLPKTLFSRRSRGEAV